MASVIEGEGLEQDGKVEAAEVVVEPAPEPIETQCSWGPIMWHYVRGLAHDWGRLGVFLTPSKLFETSLMNPLLSSLRFNGSMDIVAPKVSADEYKEILVQVKPEMKGPLEETNIGDLLPNKVSIDRPGTDYDQLNFPEAVYTQLEYVRNKSLQKITFVGYQSLALLMENPEAYLDFVEKVGKQGKDSIHFSALQIKERKYLLGFIPLWKRTECETRHESFDLFSAENISTYIGQGGDQDIASLVKDYQEQTEIFAKWKRNPENRMHYGYVLSRLIKDRHPELIHG